MSLRQAAQAVGRQLKGRAASLQHQQQRAAGERGATGPAAPQGRRAAVAVQAGRAAPGVGGLAPLPRHPVPLPPAQSLLPGRSITALPAAGNLPVKPNKYVEEWGVRREHIENEFRWVLPPLPGCLDGLLCCSACATAACWLECSKGRTIACTLCAACVTSSRRQHTIVPNSRRHMRLPRCITCATPRTPTGTGI